MSALAALAIAACGGEPEAPVPVLTWYVFDEQSGAFEQAAERCSRESGGDYRVRVTALPTDADQQREQLVRRLAAGDHDIDIIGMDVIWTAEFAAAGWILPWRGEAAAAVRAGRIAASLESASFRDRLWAAPFTTNTQLLWYRSDRVAQPPDTWDAMIGVAEHLGPDGTIQAQGERYEGLTVFFVSLLASAGGSVLDETGLEVSLAEGPTRRALAVMKRLATSPAADPALAIAREDHGRRAFEDGDSTFMVNYTYVWPSAAANAPEVASRMHWARWPRIVADLPSRATVGGINLAVGAHTRHPRLAFRAAACIASEENQRMASRVGGLPPTSERLYADPVVRQTFPFADVLRETLADAVQRPQTPLYSDISLAIGRTLHPMKRIDPERDVRRLRAIVSRALRSEGLL